MTAIVAVKQQEWRNPKKGETAMSTQVAKFIARVAENLPEVPVDLMQYWIENPLELQRVLVVLGRMPHPELKVFKILVDRTKTLAEMISAGKYDWVNPDITQEHFPVMGPTKQEREIVLFHFDYVISSDDAIAEMARAGCEPGDIADLLALGANQSGLQRQFPIVGLGSVWRDSHGVCGAPSLSRDGHGRSLHLRWLEAGWSERCRFAAVRK